MGKKKPDSQKRSPYKTNKNCKIFILTFLFQLPTISFPTFSLSRSWKTGIYGPHGDKISVIEGPDFHLENPTLHARVGISAIGLDFDHSEWKLSLNPLGSLGM